VLEWWRGSLRDDGGVKIGGAHGQVQMTSVQGTEVQKNGVTTCYETGAYRDLL
jgi:hypothetical protein